MNLVMFRFFINSNLGLPNNVGFKMKCNSQLIIVTAKSNKIVSHIPFSGKDVNWADKEDAYRSELTIYNQKDEQMVLQEIFIGKDDKFKYGYRQHSISNILEIVFEEDIQKPIKDNQSEYINKAKEYLIHFIDIYRYSTQIGFAINPRSIVSPLVDILVCKETCISDVNQKELNFVDFTFEIASETPNANVFDSFSISPDILNRLADHLSTGYIIEVHEKLIVDAREKAFVHKDYPLSIVLIETAFETYTKKKLIELCKLRGINTLQTRFHNQYEPFQDAIESGNIIGDLLKRYLNSILSISIENTSEYRSWKNNAYEKRNKIVHNGYYSYGFTDAELAFNSTIAMMDYLKAVSV